MKKLVKLNNDVGFDLGKLIGSKLLVQANSGGGKSWAIRRILEQSHGKVQQIVLDPEGEFSSLREKYDYILAGKGGDTVAEPHSAALLARKLLESGVSAIIDLYELPPQDRKRFVRFFLDEMVNAPKNLWHPCIIVLDEAHKFAPEKDQSEALESVTNMASLGRKRGFCLIPATQRPAKLSKDVAAECNNKMIGRASLDIDRKRSAEELGFTSKEEVLSLRDLDPGEFYVFGPAISKDVTKIRVGEVQTSHPKVGTRSLRRRLPKPSKSLLKVLAKFADLPKEAKEEARTVEQLRMENVTLKRENTILKKKPVVPAISTQEIVQMEQIRREHAGLVKIVESMKPIEKAMNEIKKLADDALRMKVHPMYFSKNTRIPKEVVLRPGKVIKMISKELIEPQNPSPGQLVKTTVGKGERVVLNAIAQDPEGITNEHLAVLTGYKATSRRVYTQRLTQLGLIERRGDVMVATQDGIAALGSDFKELPTGPALLDHLLSTLPEGERKILDAINSIVGQSLTRAEIAESTGYKATSVRVYVQKLLARKAVVEQGGQIRINENLV